MTSSSVRRTFLEFFAGKGHRIVPSSSLLPKDDPTLLFTNAGMNQFKNVFLGLETRGYNRAATVQKCMRVSGKHNDLDQVGRTNKHHTFFEMLGNFSFGDYFKPEAIAFAWELVTRVFGLPKDKLYVTVYEDDDEAYRLWATEAGVPKDRIFCLGKKDNFWMMGETGPCGPCSELHYALGRALAPGRPRELIEKGSNRFVELWNLVFMQYEQSEEGRMTPLPKPSIDTGMGLERMAAVLQGKKSNWETDLFAPLISALAEMAGREYPGGDEGDVSVRLIADHARAAAFLIGDGIMPANDGRGYVLRRLIRRAYRHGNLLGLEEPFVYRLIGTIADLMKDAYPELLESLTFITKICRTEEERFAQTLSSGLRYFHHYVQDARERGRTTLGGEAAFKLYDTFGFPFDLSQELAREVRLDIDEAGFREELEKQKERARQSWKGDAQRKERKVYEDLKGTSVRFAGYEAERVERARVLALVKDGSRTPELRAGEEGEGVLDVTPFYAEAGGQIGDSGLWTSRGGTAVVEGAYYPIPDLISHKIRARDGVLREGDMVEASVDPGQRRAVRDNHTATHLLHAALRQVLGGHVKQAGSLVSPSRLRFDFTHFQAVTLPEIRRVEEIVNETIRRNLPVHIKVTTFEAGLREGAMAIFEEKYGEQVRLVAVGDFSKELCGGVHAPATGEIGLFKIVSETGIAAGMRRVEAVTGGAALAHFQETEELVQDVAHALNTSAKEILGQIEKMKNALRDREHELRSVRQKMVQGSAERPADEVIDVRGISVLVKKVEGLNPAEARTLVDALKGKIKSGVVVLGSAMDEKALIVVGVTKDLTGRVSAAEMIRAVAPLIGGGGGGRPDFAQAGGSKLEALGEALRQSVVLLEEHLKNHP
jgi:alanyl-tRNA synthetase